MVRDSLKKFSFFYDIHKLNAKFLRIGGLHHFHVLLCEYYYSPPTTSVPGSSVRTATGYGPDGPEIESRWGQNFPHLSTPALGPRQPPVQRVRGLSPGVKSGRRVLLTPLPF